MKPEKDYQAEDDARTMQRAAEIHSDPKRHKAAHEHLSKLAAATKAAHTASKKAMHKKVRQGLQQAFPESQQDEQRNPEAEAQNDAS